jgi:hypothetical protein
MSTALYQTRFVRVVGAPTTKRVYTAKLAPGVAAAPACIAPLSRFLARFSTVFSSPRIAGADTFTAAMSGPAGRLQPVQAGLRAARAR